MVDDKTILGRMDEKRLSLLRRYAQAVVEAPSFLSLTAAKSIDEFWSRHVMDGVWNAAGLDAYPAGLRCLDVGTGNGIPGLVVAVARSDLHVTLLDSDSKKCGFIESFYRNNGIHNVDIVCDRAEKKAHGPLRERFDIVMARALGKLPTSLELCGAFCRLHGRVIVSHGTTWEEAVKQASRASAEMGLQLEESIPYELAKVVFHQLRYRKIQTTPDNYPRATGVPGKRPLL